MIKTKAVLLKLLSFVSLFGTTLWTGSWSSGSLLVPNTDKYKAFILMQAGQSILAIKRSTSLYVDGYTIIGSSSGTQYIKAFSAAINGNTWTYRWANEIAHNASGSHGAPKVNEEITQIIGFIPDLGGVLRNPVIAMLSAISKIGGGLSVKHKSCLAAYADLDIRALRWCKLAIYRLWHTDYSNTIKERMACSLLESGKRSNLRASTEAPDRHRDNSGRHRLDAKWKLHSLLLLCKKRSDIQYCSIPLIDNICETILIDQYGRWWLYA